MRYLIPVVLIASIFFFLTANADGNAGYTTIGSSDYAIGNSNNCNNPGILITIPEASTVSSAFAYVKNSTGSANGTISIYSGSAGSRGSLVATTNAASISTSFGWVEFSFASPVELSATTYWLHLTGQCANGPGGNLTTIKYDGGGDTNTGYKLSDAGSPTYNTNQYSMYTPYTSQADSPVAAQVGLRSSSVQVRSGTLQVR